MDRKLTILFSSLDCIGHVNACISIAEVLQERGHRIIFAMNQSWSGKLVKYGFEEELFSQSDRDPNEDPAKYWADIFVDYKATTTTPLEKTIFWRTTIFSHLINEIKILDPILREIIDRVKPDVIIMDHYFYISSVVDSSIPWVLSCSMNPLWLIDHERAPPTGSELPAIGYEEEWKKFRETVNAAVHDFWKEFNDYVISKGSKPLVPYRFINDSPYLNIYGFPLELDYLDLRPLPPNWYRFDNLKRTEKLCEFEIPEKLKNRSGKLIYFSMGSMGAADVKNMKRLVSILSKSPHRFIVSKGPNHEQYELPDNMWGERTVPQIKVLPIVDLVITHGGNNTITETFYFGKPLIVMPLFCDQGDNGIRVQEKGFGIKLKPYTCTEQQLLDAIEKLVDDEELKQRMKKISERIQTENSISKFPELVEGLVKKF